MKYFYLFFLIIGAFPVLYAQHFHAGNEALTYPDIEGYITLKTDFHQHTVFSDGEVWPSIRVSEALRENLDAISLTEHIEYQPHKKDIPHPDRNRAYEIALKEAEDHDLLIVSGSEITRKVPIGHSNAIFVTDSNKLLTNPSEAVFAEAKKQGAFIFWNHPYYKRQDGIPVWSDFQKERIQKGELHGIEVINSNNYSEESLALALEHNLTIMGTSDIHGLIDWDYTEEGNHRPITLVFAKEKTLESLKEALFEKRTVAVFNSLLVGRDEFLKPLLKESVLINEATYIDKGSILKIELENVSSSDLIWENETPYTFHNMPSVFEIKAGKSTTLLIKTIERLKKIDLKLKALRAFSAPKQQPVIEWNISTNINDI